MKILLVEDDTLVSKAITRGWPMPTDEIEVFSTYSQCARAIANSQIDAFDAVIIDMNLPDGNAVQILTGLRQRSQIPAIVISGSGNPETRASTFDLGADDYLMKPFSIRELQARVARAVRRLSAPVTNSALLNFGTFQYDTGAKTITFLGSRCALSDMEARLLAELTSHAGRVCSRKNLYEAVCLRTFKPQDKTLDIYIGRLRSIFVKHVDDELIETVRGVGYRFTLKPVRT